MQLSEALEKIAEIGIEAANRDYCRPDQEDKREGSVLGFTECRGKTIPELAALLAAANARVVEAHRDRAKDYWYWACRRAEIEWVANVVSAMLMNVGLPVIVTPTARGFLMAARIVGVLEAA